MAAIDGGTLTLVGEATIAAPASVFIQSAGSSMAAGSVVSANLTGIFGGFVNISGDTTFEVTPTGLRLGILDVEGQATVTIPPGQPNFYYEAFELGGQATMAAMAEVAYAADLALAGEASASLDAQVALGADLAMAGEAVVAMTAVMALGGELDISGDAVATADALEDDEGAADLAGGSAITAVMNVAYSDDVAIVAGSNFQALAIVHPPLTVAAPFPGFVAPDPFPGLQVGRGDHRRDETTRIDTAAQTQLIDRDETALDSKGRFVPASPPTTTESSAVIPKSRKKRED